MRPIRIIGDPVLRTPSEPVTSFDAELRALVTDLMDTLLGAPGRAGVAAPQIGVNAQVFVYDADGRRGHMINPTLELSDELQDDDEAACPSPACTSRPPAPCTPPPTATTSTANPSPSPAAAFSPAPCNTRPTTCADASTSTPCAATPAAGPCARSAPAGSTHPAAAADVNAHSVNPATRENPNRSYSRTAAALSARTFSVT